MSIYLLMSRAAAHDAAEARAVDAPLRGAADEAEIDVAAALASRIPGEALAVYISGLALLTAEGEPLAAQDFTGRWVLAVAVAVLAVMYAVGTYRRGVVAEGEPFAFPTWKVATVLVAFAGWVLIVPGSPFEDFGWYTPKVGLLIGGLVNAFLLALALFVEDV